MSDSDQTFGGATGKIAGFVELIGDEPQLLNGRMFVPGKQYPASDPAVAGYRKLFRVLSAPSPQPTFEKLGDPEE